MSNIHICSIVHRPKHWLVLKSLCVLLPHFVDICNIVVCVQTAIARALILTASIHVKVSTYTSSTMQFKQSRPPHVAEW